MKFKLFVHEVALTATVYSLIAYGYVVLVNFLQIQWLPKPFTHIDFFPLNMRTDTMGIVAFTISFFSFLTMRLTKK